MTSSRWLDEPGPVRKQEEIDSDRLGEYVAAVLPELSGIPLEIRQFLQGYSNLTYLIKIAGRSLILRRPPIGVQIASAHDMGREFRILSRLAPVWSKAPQALVFCEDSGVLGAPFYLMERIEGVILRKEMPDGMWPQPELATRIADDLIDTLVELHDVDYESAELGQLGRPQGYVRRQIEGWTKRYRHSETDSIPETDSVIRWLNDSMPTESEASLIHNDFKHDNVVLNPDDWSCVIAVLDWEMATLGDPLMDLGPSLAYWTDPGDPVALLETRLSPTTLPGTPDRAAVVERYALMSGRDVDNIVFYYAYGLFKVAVIVQQLYVRHVTGRTTDPRYARLIEGVRALSQVAWQATQKGRIDDLF